MGGHTVATLGFMFQSVYIYAEMFDDVGVSVAKCGILLLPLPHLLVIDQSP